MCFSLPNSWNILSEDDSKNVCDAIGQILKLPVLKRKVSSTFATRWHRYTIIQRTILPSHCRKNNKKNKFVFQ